MTWNLGTTNQEHLDEHNLFDHAGIATPTPGKILGVSGGKYTQVDAGTGDHDALTGVSADDHHAENHQARHQTAGADPLSGSVDANARVAIAKNGTLIGTRRRVNLVEGANVTLTVADDAGSEEVDVTIAAAASGGSAGLDHFLVSSNTTITSAGIYVVNSTSQVVTLTLPLVSSVPATGFIVRAKRLGTNLVYLATQGADHFDLNGITTKVLFVDDAAIMVSAMSGVANTWMEWGLYGTVT